jgi:protein-tyrosine kinase
MSRADDVLNGVDKRSTEKADGLGPVPNSAAEPTPTAPITNLDLNLRIDESMLGQCRLMNWVPDTKTMLFFDSQEQAPGREQFRDLRSRLYHLRERMPLRKVLVTSSLPKEGRSFTAANLAQVLACQHSCRTLLVDADLRNPSLHQSLGTLATPGLSEYLLHETEEFGILQRGPMENLFFIAAGRSISGQSELISNGRFKTLLDRIDGLFDWIIIDSPATLPVSDSGLVANFCDGVLMIVRSDSTPFDVVRKARERFRDENLLGVVLNGIPESPHKNHYYGAAPETASKHKEQTAGNDKPLSDEHVKRTSLRLESSGAAGIE